LGELTKTGGWPRWGSVIFDNAPLSLINNAAIAAHPDMRYQTLSQQEGNLLWLLLLLTQAGSNSTAQWANLGTYLQNVRWQYAGAP
jgi:isoleucyl-tRNA synthetase